MKRVEKIRYYNELFPILCPILCEMVTWNGKIPLENAVIIPRYTIEPDGGTIMGKWQPFHTCEQLVAFGREKLPDSFQLGGVFDTLPTDEIRADHKLGVRSAKSPLVLDIDIDVYDRENICECGKEKKMCNTCYHHFLKPAQRVLEYLLITRFGFEKVFFVFSGKKGMHTWVLDERVWSWTKAQRKTFLDSIAYDAHSVANDSFIMGDIFRDRNLTTDYPKFDSAVTTDPTHLKKLPLMMHQDTLFISILLPNTDSGFEFSMDFHCMKPNDMSGDSMKIFAERIKTIL